MSESIYGGHRFHAFFSFQRKGRQGRESDFLLNILLNMYENVTRAYLAIIRYTTYKKRKLPLPVK